MASKEYKNRLRIEDPEKYQRVYGTGLKKRYLSKLRSANPDRFKAVKGQYRGRKYGLKKGDFEVMLSNQSNRCMICKTDFLSTSKVYIDHCHNSGKVRGLLCLNCNVVLGHVKDNIDHLNKFIEYLS